MVYSNTAVYVGNEYGKSGHYFHYFEALNDVFKMQFSLLHFHTLKGKSGTGLT